MENPLYSVSPLRWDPKTRDFKIDINNNSSGHVSEKSLSPERGESYGAPTQRQDETQIKKPYYAQNIVSTVLFDDTKKFDFSQNSVLNNRRLSKNYSIKNVNSSGFRLG